MTYMIFSLKFHISSFKLSFAEKVESATKTQNLKTLQKYFVESRKIVGF